MPWRENKGVANLNGIYTDGLGLPVGKKSFVEIFVKEWPVARNVIDPLNTRRARIIGI